MDEQHNMTADIEEICEKLKIGERRPKITMLEALQQKCENADTALEELQRIFDECYLHLLKCYSDRFESVRDQAVQTVTHFIKRLPTNDFHLMNVTATLAERMGQQETIEESEEIRLLYVKQLKELLQQYISSGKARSLQEAYPDIIKVLVKSIRDAYPAVQREACGCVVIMARSTHTFVFQPWTEQLAKPLYGMLNHKHSMARIAAVQALGYVGLHTDASGEALSRLLMEVSPLLMDSMPLVRRECGEMGVLLLLELRDRYSYFERLIPLVLCCLKDDSPEVVDCIRPRWVECGKLYYEENEAELSKQEISDLPVANYPQGVQRPTIGCRALVQRSLRLLSLITRESSDWKENVRLHSLKLLYQFVLHAEAAMTAKFFEFYPDVARACRDSTREVIAEAAKVADLMGRLFCYDDWREHGFDGLERNAKEGYLRCFYYMFTATLNVPLEDILRFSNMLTMPEFSQTLKPEFQHYILKSVETLYAKTEQYYEPPQKEEQSVETGEQLRQLNDNMYVATVKVMALAFDADQSNAALLAEIGNALLAKLAARQQTTIGILHENCFSAALVYVQSLDAQLDELSEPIVLFHGLLSIAQFRVPYLPQLQSLIKQVWEHCADDAKVKIFTTISIAMLHWNATIDREINDSVQLLREFVTEIVEPHLLWRAGANAETMRSMATATLCAMSQGAAEEAGLVLPAMAKYMPNLLEDHAVTTRHYAVKSLANFGELGIEEMKPIAYAALQRLDDPSANIRELAAAAIPKLRPKFEKQKGDKEGDFERGIWETFIKKAVDMMFLHYEGPEVRLQKAIKGSISQLAERYPEICKASYKRTLKMSYNSGSLQDLQTEIPILA